MANDVDRVWDMAESIGVCMLVTFAKQGLHARPMTSIVDRQAGKISFLAEREAGKDDEITAKPDVLLAYSNGANKHVSIKGMAHVTDDPAVIKALWSPAAKVYLPEGPDSPGVIAIEVVPTGAEYWDGATRAVAAVKMAAALASGTRPNLGDSAKVDL